MKIARLTFTLFSLFVPLSPLRGQVTAVARPVIHYAHNRIWFVSLSNEGPTPVTMSREAILVRLNISVYPNDIAEAVLDSAAASDAKTWVKTAWNVGSPMAVAALDGTAIETKKNGPLYISGAVAIANLAVQLIGSAAPTPSKYYGEILPAGNITLQAGTGATYGVVTAYSKLDAPVGPVVIAPGGPVVIRGLTK